RAADLCMLCSDGPAWRVTDTTQSSTEPVYARQQSSNVRSVACPLSAHSRRPGGKRRARKQPLFNRRAALLAGFSRLRGGGGQRQLLRCIARAVSARHPQNSKMKKRVSSISFRALLPLAGVLAF